MSSILRRLKSVKVSYLLNIVGLAAAFAAFLVIAIQVRYDFGYNKHFRDHAKIFRVEYNYETEQNSPFSAMLSRPYGELLITSSADIMDGGVVSEEGTATVWVQGKDESSSIRSGLKKVSPSILNIFEFVITRGDVESFTRPNSAIISESTAKILFGDNDPIGKNLVFKEGASEATVTSVYKEFPDNTLFTDEIFVNIGDYSLQDQSEWSFTYYLKLIDKEAASKVREEMVDYTINVVAQGRIDKDKRDFLRLSALHDIYFSKDIRYDNSKKGNLNITRSLLSVAFLILVIAVINFINFAMAMVPVRIRSLNTRKILGSGTLKLRVSLVAEAVIISLISFAFSILILRYFSGSEYASLVSASTAIENNIGNIIISALIALLVGVAAGIYPAIYSTSFSPAVAIKGSFGLTPAGRKMRTILISFQYIISIILIVFALFINVQSKFMKQFNMGYERENIVNTRISNKVAQQKESFVERLKSNPVVSDVTFADGPLISNGKMGWTRERKGGGAKFDCLPVDPNFISFFGITVTEGRDFTEEDKLKSNGTIIFNQAAKDAYELEIGEKMIGHKNDDPADVVGFVKDFNFRPLQYGINPIALYVFGSEPWRAQTYMFVKIQPGAYKESLSHIEHTIKEFDPGIKNLTISFMDESIGKLYKKEDSLATLILISSIISVFISIIGVLGLIFFETQFRKKEIGIRKVSGADVTSIIVMFNKTYIKLVVICFFIATPITWLIINRWLNSFEYKAPIPVWIFLVAFALILSITVAAISLQSYRSATANPVDSLRSE